MTGAARSALFGHASRVAAVTTALIAALYVVVAGVLDLVVFRRLADQVDSRLSTTLALAARLDTSLGTGSSVLPRSPEEDLDDSPVILWRLDTAQRVIASTPGAPGLPAGSWPRHGTASAQIGISTFRLESVMLPGGGWMVGGQSLAQAHHVGSLLVEGELVVAPFILVAIYVGALAIGLKAAAPVERTRRRQLEFTSDASHELRTPLSVIEAEVGLALTNPREAPYYRATLERVSQEGKRLRHIVEDLLWLSRFDSQPPPPGDEPVDLVSLAAACSDRFTAVARARSIDLAVEDGGDPVLVKAPPQWVDRLLGVLVDNACRYAPVGGHVRVAAGSSAGRAFLAVSDDGPGIPDQERERLFDRFHRASDQPGGAGLGLAIADAVVRSTAGRWSIGASRWGGARMEVSWPRAVPERNGGRSRREEAHGGRARPAEHPQDKGAVIGTAGGRPASSESR